MPEHKPLRIALMGTRGIPAAYGGFETFAEELSQRLVNRGHSVTVYGRRSFFKKYSGPDNYKGVLIRVVPTVMNKYLETPLHAFFSFLDLFRMKFDIVLVCNAANSPFAWLVRLLGIPLLINVDGVERRRKKWNWLGRCWYKLGELCSVYFGNCVISDAEVIARYYRETYNCDSEVIAYGAEPVCREPGEVLARYGLHRQRYLLYVSRLEPENNALGVIQAYNAIDTDFPLVVVGDAPYAESYICELKRAADERVVFTGYQFGRNYQELQSNCFLYIQATEVGGTHPALVEAMAYGNYVIANDTPEHREVLDTAGSYYRFNDFKHLEEIITEMISNPDLVEQYRAAAKARAHSVYDWERICDRYEDLFVKISQGKH
jgi:glycosyltransferase involved in cell wall biosynthesis